MGRAKRQQVETIKNDRNYHTQKQNKAHTKTKWNNYPLKQKNIAKNYKQNETKRENHTQKNYFLLLTYRNNGKNTVKHLAREGKTSQKNKETKGERMHIF